MAFGDLVKLLRQADAKFALFGALAVAVYVPERRSTRDIDVVVDESYKEKLLQIAGEYGFTPPSETDEGWVLSL